MIITMFALALAVTPISPAEAKKLDPALLANCRPTTQQALANASRTVAPQSWKPGQYPDARLSREWRPSAYPEAGGYYTLNKMVDGCMVPVPMAGTKVFSGDRPKPAK